MKINRLALQGFIGISKGLGLEKLELDLSGLSGLIALSGQNGAGKTSVLESLHPYRTLASRKKALPAHTFLRDSFRELDFDFQGDSYKTKILVDCESGRQEGYVWKNGESMVDGKARNYDSYIENLFGSKDLFFNSIFCAQNSAKMSDLTTGKLKELFAEFLQLEKYVAYENTVKQLLGALVAQVSAYDRQIEAHQKQLSLFGDLEQQFTDAKDSQFTERIALDALEKEISDIAGNIVSVKERLAANAALEDRANDFRTRIQATEKAIETEKADYESRVKGLRESLRECKSDIAGYAAILNDRDRIEAAASKKKELGSDISGHSKEYETLYERLADIRGVIAALDLEIREAKQPYHDENKIHILEERIRNTEAKTTELGKRDPACESNICSFIISGLEAEKALPGMRDELKIIKDRLENHNQIIKAFVTRKTTEIADRKQEEAATSHRMRDIKAVIEKIQTEYKAVSKLADKIGDIQVAIVRKETSEKRAEELTGKGMKEKDAHENKISILNHELDALKNFLTEITSKIDSMPQQRLKELEVDATLKNSQKQTIIARIADLESTIREAQKNIEQRDMMKGHVRDWATKLETIKKQHSEWTYLRNAVSKDGLRALEIDSVAPSISAYANQILFNTFGPAYSVKLRTQDGEGRETLDILAIEEDGKETFLDDLSGGERVYALKALRLAMTLISKEKSGKAFSSLLCDEEDGALDDQNAENFIHMYRASMEAGGFDTCFFISHKAQCVALADSVLSFDKGGISIGF